MKALIFLALFSTQAGAQTLYKCADPGGRITYSNERCERQGLKEIGVVGDRVTVVPLKQEKSERPAETPASKVKPLNPIVEKLSQ